MSTTTPRLALYKPADDGSEFVDVATDLNQNFDKLDSSIGFIPATSSTPPPSPFAGMARQDSDTGRAWYRDSANSTWVQVLNSGSTFDSNIQLTSGKKIGIGMVPGASIDLQAATLTDMNLKMKASGDSASRVVIDSNGLALGPGNATQDVRLYRSGSGVFTTVGSLTVGNQLNVTNLSTFDDVTITGNLDINNVSSDLTVSGALSVLGVGQAIRLWKTADTNRANTATPANDGTLNFTMPANSTYLIRIIGFAGGVTAADIRTRWAVPGDATGLKFCQGPDSLSTNRDQTTMRVGVHNFSTDVLYGLSSNTLYSGFMEQGTVTTVTGGTFALMWSQASSNATASTLAQSSTLEAFRLA